ncbi:MAG: shikimate dehydrogenase [Thermodesulfovibrionales bacterium]|nr:shikimate dehydrogenase [Thermodesulfovibrionales bacterium]
MNISGKTKVVGIFGYPVEHSLSPQMHNAAFNYLNLDYCYIPFSVRPDMLEKAILGIKALGIIGVNITIPHKETVIPFLDQLTEEAEFIGSVNTIQNYEGSLIGHNTDGKGFMKSLVEKGIEIQEKRVLLIGAGGSARAIGYYLSQQAQRLYIYNRNTDRAEILQKHLNRLKSNTFVVDPHLLYERDFFFEIDIIVNTTPLGLQEEDPMPIEVSILQNHHIVCDVIYKETPLLKIAKSIGCKTINGIGMLLWQGVYAFEIWTGVFPPVDVMRQTLGYQPL